jgi:hypothetical protein
MPIDPLRPGKIRAKKLFATTAFFPLILKSSGLEFND